MTSWLEENSPTSGSTFTATGADPNTFSPSYWAAVKVSNPAYYESLKAYDPAYQAEQAAAADAAASSDIAEDTEQAQAFNPVAPTPPAPAPAGPTGPTAEQSRAAALSSLLAGFGGDPTGTSFVPGSLDDSAISGIFGAQQGRAQDYIGNLLKRGVITESGRQSGLTALGGQEPGVRTRLNDIGNLLLEQERGNVRGIYNEGAGAAGSVAAGAGFDPSPYVSRARQHVGDFSSGLADAIASQVPGDLFDTSGLGGASGAPSSGQTNLDLDPYAAPGGQLKTGLEGRGGSTPKRRSTAVF